MQNKSPTQLLADSIYEFVKNTPNEEFSIEKMTTFLENYTKEVNIKLTNVNEVKNDVPALLKSKQENISKRMRELAGIPHKGNFV